MIDLNGVWRAIGVNPTLPVNSIPDEPFQLQYSPGMVATTRTVQGWTFTFPNQDGVHYCVRPVSTALRGTIFFDTRLAGDNPAPEFHASAEKYGPLSPLYDTPPCYMRLYFQRYGDDLSGKGAYEWYRWFSQPLTIGSAGNYPLDPSKWISVYGKNGLANMRMWSAALHDVQYIGLTFGGKSFAGHGVYVAQGQTILSIADYEVH